MKHVFIINPAAGSVNAESSLREKIGAVQGDRDILIHITSCPGDAEKQVRALSEHGEELRFYACGGDGTLNEVVNGAVGFPNAQVACIPTGTGNDFIKTFSQPALFSDLSAQFEGEPVAVDLIRFNDRYAINMLNIGFDCSVVSEAARLKKKKHFSGTMAYIGGVVVVLFKRFGQLLRVVFEDRTEKEEPTLLIAIANGMYCGGGFKTGFSALLNDSLLDVCYVRKLGRLSFLRLVGKYRNGTYMDCKLGKKYVDYFKCGSISLHQKNGFELCADGEVLKLDDAEISVSGKALRFCVPKGSSLLSLSEEAKE